LLVARTQNTMSRHPPLDSGTAWYCSSKKVLKCRQWPQTPS
jgi:hypothetical protein